ncbi:hypothetical protein Q3O59_13670 [Alkalimonas delamerensis]|uniref:Lipoprotein n=1 Tax=Alkalimonas delamerensis TaxID=265981 RepID=A0ABT9GSV9_9GAMM|nr:hypothetical protein [Alkalimonas delamerensis]MDP4530071.1 hypothetical protein [Alkalimonas delamerensis]
MWVYAYYVAIQFQGEKYENLKISKSQNLKISKSQNLKISKSIFIVSLIASTAILQGCSSVEPIDLESCRDRSQTVTESIGTSGASRTTTTEGRNCGGGSGGVQAFLQRVLRTVYAYTGFQSYNLDFSQFRMDISTHNAQFQNQPGNLSITLFNGDHSLAEKQFAYNASGNTLTLANPQAVQHWVAGFEGIADGYAVSVTGLQLSQAVGQHSMHATAKFGNQHLATFNWQGYAGNDCDTCVMQ